MPLASTTSTLRFTRLEGLMCLIHDDRQPSMEDWKVYVQALVEAVSEHAVRRLLVVSRGGGPNAAQRKLLVRDIVPALGGEAWALRTAVCTSSPLARGITVALGWISTGNLTGFGYDERRRALEFLEIPIDRHAAVLAEIKAQIGRLEGAREAR
jgi:hypothetical protein